MHLICTGDVEAFAGAARDFLRSERFSSNVVAVQAEGMLRRERPDVPGALWILVTDGGRVVGVATHTPPHHLFVSRTPPGVPEMIATELAARGRPLPGVSGERTSADAFAAAWNGHCGTRHRLEAAMRMYVLGRLRPPPEVAGGARVAAGEHAGLLAGWMRAFHDEAQPDTPLDDADDLVRRRIEAGGLWLWQRAGTPVSFAGVSAPAAGVARVGPVYTPPTRRRNGYGAAVTAAASVAATASGAEHVVLYADLTNATSNAIYQSIGYEAHHDAVQYEFVPS